MSMRDMGRPESDSQQIALSAGDNAIDMDQEITMSSESEGQIEQIVECNLQDINVEPFDSDNKRDEPGT